MAPRPLRRGLRQPPPMLMADVLEDRYSELGREAKKLAIGVLAVAVASGNPANVAPALGQIDRRLDDVLTERDVEEVAESVAKRVDASHAKAFYSALGAAVGLTVLAQGSGGSVLPPGIGSALGGELPRKKLRGVLIAKLSAEPRLLADQFARKNAALITTLRSEIVPALRDEVVRAVEMGMSPELSAQRLIDKWRRQGVPIARGNLEPRVHQIVGDQIAKLNADLTKSRQTSAGIREFRWISRRDARVRPLHQRIDGSVYSWASGHPEEGYPGEPINCRCFAEAVVDRDAVLASTGFIHLAEAEVEFAA